MFFFLVGISGVGKRASVIFSCWYESRWKCALVIVLFSLGLAGPKRLVGFVVLFFSFGLAALKRLASGFRFSCLD